MTCCYRLIFRPQSRVGIHLNNVCYSKATSSESHVHLFSFSFNLEEILRLFLTFMILTLFNITVQLFFKKFLNLSWSDIFSQSDSGYKSLQEEYHRSDTVFSIASYKFVHILIGLIRGIGNFDHFIRRCLPGFSTKKLLFPLYQLINIGGGGYYCATM